MGLRNITGALALSVMMAVGFSSTAYAALTTFSITSATVNNGTGASAMQISWGSAGTGATYKVSYGTKSGSYTTQSASTSANTFLITGLTAGTTYYFMVTAKDSAGTSLNATKELSGVPMSKAVIASLTQINATQATITWSGAAGSTKSYVKYGTSATGALSSYASSTGSTSPAVVSGLTAGTLYYAIVTATNGTSNYLDSASRVSVSMIAAPTALRYATATASYKQSQAIATNAPTASGGAISSYSISPNLPAGLALNATSGAITGTPTGVSAATTYTVTAKNIAGSTTAAISIAVAAAAPTSITYTSTNLILTKGTALALTAPSHAGGAPTAFTSNVSLPAGLVLNATTGAISGIPTAVGSSALFTITGKNSSGSASTSITMTVNDVAPSNLKYTLASATYTVGTAMASNSPTSAGGAITSYSISPSLPAGLGLNSFTGVISGTPSSAVALQNYIVTAKNSGGSTSATLSIAVQSAAIGAFTLVSAKVNNSVGANALLISWNAANYATSYTVNYGTASGVYGTSAGTTATTSLLVKNLTAGTPYYFMVTATNASGSSVNATQAISGTPMSQAVITGITPVGLTQANIAWTGGAGAASFSVKYGTTASGQYNNTAGSPSVSPQAMTGLSAGTSYTVTVTAINGSNYLDSSTTPTFTIAAATPTPVPVATPNMNGVPASTLFKVQVTQAGVASDKFVYVSKAATVQEANQANGYWGKSLGKTFNYSIFSGPGPYTIQVTKLGSAATAATIRPTRLGLGTIATTKTSAGSTVTFTLANFSPVSIEFNDDTALKDEMVIMAQPSELAANVPTPTDASVYDVPAGSTTFAVPTGKSIVYFEPGVHSIGKWKVPTTVTQIYFAENSFVYGIISSNPAGRPAIKVNGRGVLSGDGNAYTSSTYLLQLGDPTWTTTSTGNLLEGIALVDSPEYTSQFMASSSTIEYVLFHGFQLQNDGIHLAGVNNTIQNNFFHVNDDNICISIPGDGTIIKNNVFWAMEGGSSVQLGYVVHSLANISVTHSDVIHASWGGALAYTTGGFIQMINATDNANSATAVVQSLTVSDLQVEEPVLRLIDTRMIHGTNIQTVSYKNFTFSDIHLDHQGTVSAATPLLLFDAADTNHTITNFQFTNFTLNGSAVTQSTATSNSGIMYLNGPVNVPVFH